MASFPDILRGNCSTLVVQEHLSQLGMFLWRNGLEILPVDNHDLHEQWLDSWWKFNRIDSYFQDIWQRGATTGEILLYIKPLDDNQFKIRYYDAKQFEYEQDDYGLRKVIIKGRSAKGTEKNLTITRRAIGGVAHGLGFVPCVLIQNRPSQAGRGLGEFAGFESILERHDWLVDQIRGNLEYFGGPIFYSSRSLSELIDSGAVRVNNSPSVLAGYGTPVGQSERVRPRRVISGVEDGEQLGFANPEAISPEVIRWIDNYEAKLRRSLGGVPSDKTYGFTDLDVISYFALAISTAEHRSKQYITNGIVRAFELMFVMSLGREIPLRWRYLGSLFPDTAQTQLTKSIVSRNLLRLGVNLPSALRHIFPDKSEEEINADLDGGFAYELLNGLSRLRQSFDEDPTVVSALVTYLLENMNDG